MHVSSKIYQVRNITDRERLITCEEPITTIRTSVCESLQIPIIGASLSEPHTSESNGGFIIYIYIYIFIYLPYVRRSVNAG